MNCPECEHTVLHIYDSRKMCGGVLRKRKCNGCGFRFYTFESVMSEEEFEDLQLRRRGYDTGSESETESEETA